MFKLHFNDKEGKQDVLYLFLVSAPNNQCTFTCLNRDFSKVEASTTISTADVYQNILRIIKPLGEYSGFEGILPDPEMGKWMELSK
ncbi:MAG: hypothetical protein IPP77_03790 [Bacteroidetes bacterium]|nr:hypothetical protein [Bacteroidota bacterium]